MRRPYFGLLAVLVALLGLAAWPFAAARGEESSVAEVVVTASGGEASAFAEALAEPLQRLGLTIHASFGDAPPHDPVARARIWIDARAGDRVDVTMELLPGTRTVVRQVPRLASGTVLAEEVAFVVRSTLESELSAPPPAPAGAPAPPASSTSLAPSASVSPAPPAPPAPAPASSPAASVDAAPGPAAPGSIELGAPAEGTPRRPGRLGLDVAAFVDARAMASSAVAVPGVGGAVGFSFGRPASLRPALWLTGTYVSPFETVSPEVDLTMRAWAVRALPALQWEASHWLHLSLAVGVGFDAQTVEPRPALAAASLGPRTTSVEAVIASHLLVEMRLVGSASLVGGVELDASPRERRYLAEDAYGQTSTVLEPWRVHPGLLLGLCVPLTASAGCGGPP